VEKDFGDEEGDINQEQKEGFGSGDFSVGADRDKKESNRCYQKNPGNKKRRKVVYFNRLD